MGQLVLNVFKGQMKRKTYEKRFSSKKAAMLGGENGSTRSCEPRSQRKMNSELVWNRAGGITDYLDNIGTEGIESCCCNIERRMKSISDQSSIDARMLLLP